MTRRTRAKPIILIGGAAGTGKSTLANQLCARLGLDHRIGTGFIRAVVCSETTPDIDDALFSYTFRAADPVDHIRRQSQRLRAAVMACIVRADDEGTSLVVEGAHLLPSLYHDVDVDLFLILEAPPAEEHLDRLRGATHARRAISANDWRNARRIDEVLGHEARSFDVPHLLFRDNLDEVARLLAAAKGDRR